VPYSFAGSWHASLPGIEVYGACPTSALASRDAAALAELTGVLPFRCLAGRCTESDVSEGCPTHSPVVNSDEGQARITSLHTIRPQQPWTRGSPHGRWTAVIPDTPTSTRISSVEAKQCRTRGHASR